MSKRAWRGLALAGLAVVVLAGCREEAGDRKVIEELSKHEIVAIPDGATELDREEHLGGGSDVAAIKGASTITLTYATDRSPVEVAQWFHDAFDDDWELYDNGYAPIGGTAMGGRLRSDEATGVTVEARPSDASDAAPAGSRAVVVVSVSKTRE